MNFWDLFRSEEVIRKRKKDKREQKVNRKADEMVHQTALSYKKSNNLDSIDEIGGALKKAWKADSLIKARKYYDEKDDLKKRNKNKFIPMGILGHSAYANGAGIGVPEGDYKEETIQALSAFSSRRGNISSIDTLQKFTFKPFAIAFHKTFFGFDTEQGKEMYHFLKVPISLDEQSKQLVANQKLTLEYWPEALKRTGKTALFKTGERSRYNPFRFIEFLFNWAEESLDFEFRKGLPEFKRPSHWRAFGHLTIRLLLNIVRVGLLFLFTPFFQVGEYFKKNPYFFVMIFALMIIAFFLPPVGGVVLGFLIASAETLGLGFLVKMFAAIVNLGVIAKLFVAVYTGLLVSISSLKLKNTIIAFVYDLKLVLWDKHFWLWDLGRGVGKFFAVLKRDGILKSLGRLFNFADASQGLEMQNLGAQEKRQEKADGMEDMLDDLMNQVNTTENENIFDVVPEGVFPERNIANNLNNNNNDSNNDSNVNKVNPTITTQDNFDNAFENFNNFVLELQSDIADVPVEKVNTTQVLDNGNNNDSNIDNAKDITTLQAELDTALISFNIIMLELGLINIPILPVVEDNSALLDNNNNVTVKTEQPDQAQAQVDQRARSQTFGLIHGELNNLFKEDAPEANGGSRVLIVDALKNSLKKSNLANKERQLSYRGNKREFEAARGKFSANQK